MGAREIHPRAAQAQLAPRQPHLQAHRQTPALLHQATQVKTTTPRALLPETPTRLILRMTPTPPHLLRSTVT